MGGGCAECHEEHSEVATLICAIAIPITIAIAMAVVALPRGVYDVLWLW